MNCTSVGFNYFLICRKSKRMSTKGLSLDRISCLPQKIIESILSLMPIRDALRTSVLSKRWQYCWRGMPKLTFTNNMVKLPSKCACTHMSKYKVVNDIFHVLLLHNVQCACTHMSKYKVVNAIFHVLLLHNGPTILELKGSVKLEMLSEFDPIISHLSTRNNTVKELTLTIEDGYYNLPLSFFSVQGLEHIHLQNCGLEPPSTFNGFSNLRSIVFMNVVVSAKMLQRFLSNCPLLTVLILVGYQLEVIIAFASGGNAFTFVDLFRCAPLINILVISKCYTKVMYRLNTISNVRISCLFANFGLCIWLKYLSAGGMPHQLPTPLAHLKCLCLDVCLMEHNEISSVLCMIRSSPLLDELVLMMYDKKRLGVEQTPTNFLDPENYSDLKLDHLETLEMNMTRSNLPLGMDLVKLVMAKAPVLKKVQLDLNASVSIDDEVIMLRDLVLLPFARASPSAKLIIRRR
ncbi:putative F-box domain, leucine-rich repeat domain superfamily, F-box-like domain superfamily [Helianthus annuus]|nr:putative F-box domain, leucine-rich repeat domain superfamily, F-box-like domain superfamily [Helianthus annuus]